MVLTIDRRMNDRHGVVSLLLLYLWQTGQKQQDYTSCKSDVSLSHFSHSTGAVVASGSGGGRVLVVVIMVTSVVVVMVVDRGRGWVWGREGVLLVTLPTILLLVLLFCICFDSCDSLLLYLEDDGFRPWPNLLTGPR